MTQFFRAGSCPLNKRQPGCPIVVTMPPRNRTANKVMQQVREDTNPGCITASHKTNFGGEKVNATISVISNMVAICFYTPASYEELKKVADDKKNLCDTYADWLVEFSKAVRGLKEQGLEATPVNINISELKKWCKQNNLKNTSSSRSKYVLEISNSRLPNSD